jgi:hypothetical protein
LQRKIEQIPSNIEITQFHTRFVELFDNLNFKSDENRKYNNLFNTLQDAKLLFDNQYKILHEVNDMYKQAGSKKNKEILLHNLQLIIKPLKEKVALCNADLEKTKQNLRQV